MNSDSGMIYTAKQVEDLKKFLLPAQQTKFVLMRVPPSPPQRARGRVGRNDPCPCGSGKKFKRCCCTGNC